MIIGLIVGGLLFFGLIILLLVPKLFLGKRGLLIRDKYGNYTYKKVSKVDDEMIYVGKNDAYPICQIRFLTFPFPLNTLRIYFLEFENEELRGDFNTIRLYIANAFLREISKQIMDLFGVISVVLLVIVLIFLGFVYVGQGDIKTLIQKIMELFNQGMGGAI